jgi:glutamate dehydrogenase
MIDPQTQRDALLNKIITYLQSELPEPQRTLIAKFVEQYYAIVAYEDLRENSIMDLAGAILSHWKLLYQRSPDETKVHVFNPSYEENGWQSTHTVIDIAKRDMPFLVDSVRMEIARRKIPIHFIVHPGGIRIKRNKQNCIVDILPRDVESDDSELEATLHFEINRINDPKILEELYQAIENALFDVEIAVADWQKMSDQIDFCITDLKQNPPPLDKDEVNESIAFLEWLAGDNFTFLGFRDYDLVGKGDKQALRIVENTGLGVLSDSSSSQVYRNIADMTDDIKKILFSPQILIIAKTNTKSSIHRDTYTDYIGVKRFDSNGKMIGERRFIGLFTSVAYHSNPQSIPFLRHKVAQVIKLSNLNTKSHAGKALLNILEIFPRDDLFQASVSELARISLGILNIQERSKVKLFVRKDVYGRYMSCLVYMPRDRYSAEIRHAIQAILQKAFDGLEIAFSTQFGESVLARIHFVIRIDPNAQTPEYDLDKLENKIVNVTRLWSDDLEQLLHEHYGEERGGKLSTQYKEAFPASYREDFEARIAVSDIKYIEKTLEGEPLCMGVYRPITGGEGNLHFKLFRKNETVPLSDVIPILENMGLRVLDERPYEISLNDDQVVWINDYDMVFDQGEELNTTLIKSIFKDAFAQIWKYNAENDGFNRLVLSALLSWREVVLLRAYAKYLRQISFTFSQNYIERAFANYPEFANLLVQLFKLYFDPELAGDKTIEIKNLEKEFEQKLESVTNLDEDKIFRCYKNLITATLRTNYFQLTKDACFKPYISIKLSPANIPECPLPRPAYEIFVYSPEFEGVHLRSGKVARGGLRWSDRIEDFRTEILGLMKAQAVKNAVIVPDGAKGGFVLKCPPVTEGREALQQAVIACYQNFIRGMLDITDNTVDGEVVHPKQVVCRDGDDPYLVVAADKGTATFSDIANQIAQEYNFWLGDAFASGGSNGYDHKKMAITARGAWESVKRHFLNLGVDTQTTDFTVVGIGDMSGDVFGNGMLLSEHICLVAAFNHLHIFIDPTPNAITSYQERKRLFDLPRSSWTDYDKKLISQGGGIFKRSDKSLKLTPEIKKLLDIDPESDTIVPDILIRKILSAKVDLLWNGGIGTYVKSKKETNADAGDKSNDAVRINGQDLNCKVVGEGGNLGFTQLGRIEYALKGGLIYTDFIDNSGGVDCSDHEVNLKILLNSCVAQKQLSESQRNKLLANLSDEVGQLVLQNNIEQTKAIDLALAQNINLFDLNRRYINELDRTGYLNRQLEYLPSNKELTERKAENLALTAPETAILLAYSKNYLKANISKMNLVNSNEATHFLRQAFPKKIAEKFPENLAEHQLRHVIVATQIANMIVNEMGSSFIYRLADETGAQLESIVKAYIVARQIFNIPDLWKQIDDLATEVEVDYRNKMTISLIRLVRRATRWLLRNYRAQFNISEIIEYFDDKIEFLHALIPQVIRGRRRELVSEVVKKYSSVGVPRVLMIKLASISAMFSSLDIIQAAEIAKKPIAEVAKFYFAIGDELNLAWLREQINNQIAETHWETLSLSAFRDDLDRLQRVLAVSVINYKAELNDVDEQIQAWIEQHKHLVDRWHTMEAQIRASRNISLVMLFVGLRELIDLAESSYDVEANKTLFNRDNYI